MVRTLYSLSDLRDSKFGQPSPRHGLRLLWWFAKECVRIDYNGRLIALCDPEKGDVGFRPFYNIDRHLPFITNYPYYKTGNLKYCGSLPRYVTENCKQILADRNKDRIIVSIDSDLNGRVWFDDVYVIEHSDETHFDQNHTYHISQDLIKAIKSLNLEDFLKEMKAKKQINYNQQPYNQHNFYNQQPYNQQLYYNQHSRNAQLRQTTGFQNPTYDQQRSYVQHQSFPEEVCQIIICVVALFVVFYFLQMILSLFSSRRF